MTETSTATSISEPATLSSEPATSSSDITLEEVLRLASGTSIRSLFELAIDLELFAKLRGRSVPFEELGEVWQMPKPSARFMAQFLLNVKLLQYRGDEVANGPLAETMLTGSSLLRDYLLPMPFKYGYSADEFKQQLMDPPVSPWYQLRDGGKITDGRAVLRQDSEDWNLGLVEDRHDERIIEGRRLAQLYDFGAHRKLVDLGGASGGYCIGIRESFPELECVVFDLPDVVEIARTKFADTGQAASYSAVGGSFFDDEYPPGDAALLSQVIHNWSPEDDRTILRKAFAALEPGGALVVHETFFEDDWSGSIEAIFYAFLMVGQEGRCGWQPSFGEMEALLREVGFIDLERRHTLVIGRKPQAA